MPHQSPFEVYYHSKTAGSTLLPSMDEFDNVYSYHRSLPGYTPTPLLSLSDFAGECKVGSVFIKDESKRFGLNAFKGLGASYALHALNPAKGSYIVAATDGNHGRAVAFSSRMTNCHATIFLPKGSSPHRLEAIQNEGAEAILSDVPYDETVRLAKDYAIRHHAVFVQDTALPGYEEVPKNIVLGYSTMAREALEQMGKKTPTHVFLPVGVGSTAAGVLQYLKVVCPIMPKVILMEAVHSACGMESLKRGKLTNLVADIPTVMAGLWCGELNPSVFGLLSETTDAVFAIEDQVAEEGMRIACYPKGNDPSFISGACGAVGLGLLAHISKDFDTMDKLGLDSSSRCLFFSTEGNTDPDHYHKVIHGEESLFL